MSIQLKGDTVQPIGTLVSYKDNNDNTIYGFVAGYDSHLRYIVKTLGASVFDGHSIVSTVALAIVSSVEGE